MNKQSITTKKLTIKDLVITGIFTALFFIFTMIGGGIFAVNPLLTFYMPIGSGLVCGPIYLLMVAKVGKRWNISILGITMGLIWLVTGMHWAFAFGYILMGLLADLTASIGKYKRRGLNIVSYMLLSLGGVFTYGLFFIDPAGWTRTMLKNGTDAAYIDTMKASAPSWLFVVIVMGTLFAAALSGWLGSRLLKKQFEKSGII